MTDSIEHQSQPIRQRFLTPTVYLMMLVASEVLSVLADRFDWLPVNEKKGWTVLLCVVFAGAALLLLGLVAVVRLLARWPMQFNLSALLVLVVALAIPSSWFAAETRAARRQRDAVAACHERGCSCFYDYSIRLPGQLQMYSGSRTLPIPYEYLGEDFFHDIVGAQPSLDEHLELLRGQTKIHTLLANNSGITDEGLAPLSGFKSLRWLELSDSPYITAAGMEHLSDLPHLERVMLRRTKISDEGLIHLRDKKGLLVLDLGMTKVSGTGLQHLAASTKLRELHFWGNPIEDASLAAIREMTSLRTLDLGGASLTDAGLKHLSRLTELEMLGVRGAAVTDEGVRDIASHGKLRRLDLFNTQVSDVGLEHVAKLQHLELIYIGETKVTAAGLAKLQAALPKCQIK